MKIEKRFSYLLLVVLITSVSVTVCLLFLQDRWFEAVPLHLCSVSAIAAAALLLVSKPFLLDFLWYLGMPGAFLALLFPAPISSICQMLMNASYFMTHILILVIPLCKIAWGMRPRRGKTIRMMFVLLAIAGLAAAANDKLGTDFLFLSSPPTGTPLEAVFRLGCPLYYLMLFALMLLCCTLMDAAAGKIGQRGRK